MTPRLRISRTGTGMLMFLALLATLFGPVGQGLATQTAAAAPLNSVPTVSVTVPAGGSAFLQVRALAYQSGAAIPQGPIVLAPQPLANDTIRTILFYGLDWGYTESNPQQVALAVWWAREGAWPSPDHAIAERIANAAASAPGLPSWNVDGRSILGLVAQGQLTLSDLRLTPSALSPAAGGGILQINNTGAQDLLVYLPYGSLFIGTSGSALVWATGVAEGPPPPAPTEPAPPPATATTVPQVSPTATTSYKQGYTPTAEATATESVKAPPATPAEEVPTNTPPAPTSTTEPAAPSAAQPASPPSEPTSKA